MEREIYLNKNIEVKSMGNDALPTPEFKPESTGTYVEGQNRQSGRSSRPHRTKGNHRSDTRGKGFEAFMRNKWMKSI